MRKASTGLILAAGIMWGSAGLFVRTLSSFGFDSGESVFIKSAVSLAVLLIGLIFTDRKALKIHWKDLWIFLGTGIFSVAFFNYCYFKTILLTSMSVAAVLLYTSPAFVMALSAWLFKEHFSAKKLFAILLTILGCAFATGVFTGTNVLSTQGIVMGLCAGFGYALYSIFSRVAIHRGYSAATITGYTFFFAGLCFFFLTNKKHMVSCLRALTTGDFIEVILLSLLITLLPFMCYTIGLREVENSRAAIVVSIEPVAATLLGVLFYHEKMTMAVLIGIGMVLISIFLINTGSKKT